MYNEKKIYSTSLHSFPFTFTCHDFRKNSLKTELDFYFNNILNRDSSCETVYGSTSSTPNSTWYFYKHQISSFSTVLETESFKPHPDITHDYYDIKNWIIHPILQFDNTIHLFHTLYIQLIHDLFHYCLLTS